MNEIWTSAFTKINPHKESFESNIEELLRINGFHLITHKDQNISENSSENHTSTSTNQNHYLDNEIEEVHLQVTSRSVSRLQGQNISKNTTVLKVYSKTTLKENELTNKLSNTETNAQKEASLCERNEVPDEYDKVKDKLRNSCRRTGEKCVSDDKMEKSQFHQRPKNTDNRIENPLARYPPELIEIYFSKKDVDSDKELCTKTFSKEDECCASNSGDSVSFFGTNIAEMCTAHNMKHAKLDSLNENGFLGPTRDRQNIDYKLEKNRNLNEECPIENKTEVNDSETSGELLKEKRDEKIELDIKDSCTIGTQLQKLCRKNEDSPVIDEVTLKDLSVDEENVRSNCKERKCNTENINLNSADDSLKSENFANFKSPKAEDFVENCKTVEKSEKCSDGEKLNTKIDDCRKIENMNFSLFEDTLLTRAKENQNICLNSTFIKTDVCKINENNVKSNNSEASKSSLNSEGSEDLSSIENETVIRNEEKSSVKSLKENKIKIVIEKRESKKDNFDRNVFDDAKSNLLGKNVRSSIIDDKKEIQESQHEIAETEVPDCKDKIITQKMIQINDYEHMDICKMLTHIHGQLTYDLKRIKDIEAKLQGKVSASSNNYTMPLQLLDKIVARCKSYIHGSNNSQKAQSEIAKIFSTYGEHLMVAVNKNNVVLNEQELRINQMQFHGQNVNNKRNILKEINSSWNYWQPEIVYLIETISDLVKNVMDKNEEKENVKDPRKYKPIYRHGTNNSIVHSLKSKHRSDRLKPPKPNLFRKESAVETQISVASNLYQTKSKTSVKQLDNVVNREKEKIQNDIRISEKKTIDKARTRKETSKNKNHECRNQQPVWKPGGIVKIPSSNSATMLQKIRPNIKEKANLFAEHSKAEKPNKTVNISKKKVSDEISSIKNILLSMRTTLTSNSHNTKMVGKRSNTSLKISPKMKPRPGILRAAPRVCNEPDRQIPRHPNSKYSESKCSHDDAQKRSKESKPLSPLKENDREDVKNIINCQFDDKISRAAFGPPSEAILIKEEKEESGSNKEEPTRDDSSRSVKNLPKLNDAFHENRQITETIPDEALNLSKKCKNIADEEINPNLDKYQSKGSSDYICDTNCVADFSSKYECTPGFENSTCQTSFNSVSSSSTRNPEEKNEKRDLDEEMQKTASITKSRANSHALSLNMLKKFLCEQGIDPDLVNRAEREMKDKQKTSRYSKKKSISFADMFFSVRDDQRLQKALKNERLWDMLEGKEENDINCGNNEENGHKDDIDREKSLKCTENVSNCETSLKQMENVIDSAKTLKYAEYHTENINCKESLTYAEHDGKNDINCKKSLTYAECHEKNDINREKSLKCIECHEENNINCEKSSKQEDGIDSERSSKHTENYIANVVDCETNLECTKNFVNHEKNLKHTENCKGSIDCEKCSISEKIKGGKVMNCENLKYIERHEENVISCERRLKHVRNVTNYERDLRKSENDKANDINFQKNSKPARICNDNGINCGKSLRYAEKHEDDMKDKKNLKSTKICEDDVTNCEASLKHVEHQKENNSNYENSLKLPRGHIEIDISPEKNLRHKENNSHCGSTLNHTENHKENNDNRGSSAKHVKNHKENNSNCKSSINHTENHKGGSINSERDFKYTKNYKESKINCESSLKNVESHKENNSNYTKDLKYIEHHKDTNIHDYKNSRYAKTDKENYNNYGGCLKQLANNKFKRNSRPIGNQKGSSIKCDNRNHIENRIERNNYLEEPLKHTENHGNDNNNCDISSKHPENHREIDIDCEKNLRHTEYSKERSINCDSSLNHAENYRESNNNRDSLNDSKSHKRSNINCDSNLTCVGNHKENDINCDISLKYAENQKENNIDSDSSLNCGENDKESNINCDSSLKYVDHKESNINCDKNLKYEENHKESGINCDSSLKYVEDHRESNINCDKNLKYEENHKESNVNCDNNLIYAENHKESNINCDNALNNSENHKEHNSNCEGSLKYTKNHREIDINRENTFEYINSLKENDLVKHSGDVENCKENYCEKSLSHKEHLMNCNELKPTTEDYEIVNYKRNSTDSPQREMKDAASCIEISHKDAYSQTNFQIKESKTLQSVLQNNATSKKLRVTETQTEVCCVKSIIMEGRNASSMTEALPVNDNSTETMAVSFVSTSVATEQIDCIFSNNFRRKNSKKESCKLSKSIETTFDGDSENSTKKCDNSFHQLLNQIQEYSFNCEKDDAWNELCFVESNASTSTSGSFPEHGIVMKHAHTSPIKTISSETMAAFHATAIRIRNIYRAIDIYNRKLRNEVEDGKRSKRVNKICKEKPSCVSKSSSVDTIFTRKNGTDRNDVVRMFEALEQAEVDAEDVYETEQEDSESVKSSSMTWSYESTCGKVELKISGKLSDTVILKDVGSLMDFLVQKTEDSIGKADRVQKVSNNACTRFQETETTRFPIFSREILLSLVYGVVCSIVFWCLHFTITCDTVS